MSGHRQIATTSSANGSTPKRQQSVPPVSIVEYCRTQYKKNTELTKLTEFYEIFCDLLKRGMYFTEKQLFQIHLTLDPKNGLKPILKACRSTGPKNSILLMRYDVADENPQVLPEYFFFKNRAEQQEYIVEQKKEQTTQKIREINKTLDEELKAFRKKAREQAFNHLQDTNEPSQTSELESVLSEKKEAPDSEQDIIDQFQHQVDEATQKIKEKSDADILAQCEPKTIPLDPTSNGYTLLFLFYQCAKIFFDSSQLTKKPAPANRYLKKLETLLQEAKESQEKRFELQLDLPDSVELLIHNFCIAFIKAVETQRAKEKEEHKHNYSLGFDYKIPKPAYFGQDFEEKDGPMRRSASIGYDLEMQAAALEFDPTISLSGSRVYTRKLGGNTSRFYVLANKVRIKEAIIHLDQAEFCNRLRCDSLVHENNRAYLFFFDEDGVSYQVQYRGEDGDNIYFSLTDTKTGFNDVFFIEKSTGRLWSGNLLVRRMLSTFETVRYVIGDFGTDKTCLAACKDLWKPESLLDEAEKVEQSFAIFSTILSNLKQLHTTHKLAHGDPKWNNYLQTKPATPIDFGFGNTLGGTEAKSRTSDKSEKFPAYPSPYFCESPEAAAILAGITPTALYQALHAFGLSVPANIDIAQYLTPLEHEKDQHFFQPNEHSDYYIAFASFFYHTPMCKQYLDVDLLCLLQVARYNADFRAALFPDAQATQALADVFKIKILDDIKTRQALNTGLNTGEESHPASSSHSNASASETSETPQCQISTTLQEVELEETWSLTMQNPPHRLFRTSGASSTSEPGFPAQSLKSLDQHSAQNVASSSRSPSPTT